MISSLSRKLTSYLFQKKIIEDDKQEIYQYGYEVLISGLIGFIIAIIIGLLLGRFFDSLLFLVIFVPIRQLCGGFHASSYLKCNITFTIIFSIIMLVSDALVHFISLLYIIIMSILSIWSMIKYAPIENPNKPLDSEQKRKNRNAAITTSIIISLLTIAVFFINIRMSILMALTMFSIAALMLVEKIKNTHRKS